MTEAEEEPLAGRYRLAEVLGQGGMGRVWRGRDELLRRDVAVKEILFPPELTAEERDAYSRRALREARAAARLNHPGIVTVHDVIMRGSSPVIVMELLRGPSLAQAIAREGRLPPDRVAAIARMLLEALERAHEAGIVHRDLKPANVLLVDGRAVITDFGIAGFTDDTTLTLSGALMGTPAFMAPEQVRERDVGPPADLWSLGATLYAAVEGRPPYDAANPIAAIAALMGREPDPPVHAGPLAPLLRGLLRKDPGERLTARQALAALPAITPPRPDAAEGTAPAGTAPMPSTRPAPAPTAPVTRAAPIAARPAPDASVPGAPAATTPTAPDATPTASAGPAVPAESAGGEADAAPAVPRAGGGPAGSRDVEGGRSGGAPGPAPPGAPSAGAPAGGSGGRPGPAPTVVAEPTAHVTKALPEEEERRSRRGVLIAGGLAALAAVGVPVGIFLRREPGGGGGSAASPSPGRSSSPRPRTWTLTGTADAHDGQVRALAVAADGSTVATGGDDRTVRLWDGVRDGSPPVAVLPGHSGAVVAVAFGGGGKILASADSRGDIRLWETPAGRSLGVVQGARVRAVAVNAYGGVVAAGREDGTVSLWDVRTHERIADLRGHRGAVRAVAFDRSSSVLVAASDDGTVRFWNVEDTREGFERRPDLARRSSHRTLTGGGGAALALAVSEDHVAAGWADGSVRVWDRNGAPVSEGREHGRPVRALAWGNGLAAAAEGEKVVRFRGTDSQGAAYAPVTNPSPVTSLAFGQLGRTLIAGGADGKVREWTIS
ncbi:WD40 repeat domain-containing serine/threonine protein kinase [Bailinhaonella thermotolerans]|uniref:WD40 repeat domain-containing serine/threonine protein kinase n=1 Tax=Bailinhaonella thermotolerans TaxID=1070861 RepID=UPI0011C3CD59|nr:serine/threonine-protein kinase [Bailinhaonella thermotolerans]